MTSPFMAENDEVVLLAKEILQGLLSDDDDQFSVFWRLFLSHTNDLRRVLKARLTKANWPAVYRSLEGERILHVSIAGACPSGILLGLIVWLCEAQYFDCDMLCSVERLHLDRSVPLVLAALKDKGWSLKLKSTSEHFTDLRFDGPGLDVLIVAHPENSDDWLEALEYVRRDGCVVILDACRARSFAMIEKTEGFEYAPPMVMDGLPCGVTTFDTAEGKAIEAMRDHTATMATELPLPDEDSVAALYVRKTEPFKKSVSDSPTDSWAKYDTSLPETTVMELPDWTGHWSEEIDACSVPRRFLFSAVDQPLRLDARGNSYREYYRRLGNRCWPSRMQLEGMGRPMLSSVYRDQRRHLDGAMDSGRDAYRLDIDE